MQGRTLQDLVDAPSSVRRECSLNDRKEEDADQGIIECDHHVETLEVNLVWVFCFLQSKEDKTADIEGNPYDGYDSENYSKDCVCDSVVLVY